MYKFSLNDIPCLHDYGQGLQGQILATSEDDAKILREFLEYDSGYSPVDYTDRAVNLLVLDAKLDRYDSFAVYRQMIDGQPEYETVPIAELAS